MIKTRMFAMFGLGALVATISLGAVQYASANGGTTITACANKSSGMMRYITKGACKKTERKVTWNSQGPTGPQGVGTPGLNGQNLYAIDATGKDVGLVTNSNAGGWITLFTQNGLFDFSTNYYGYPPGNGSDIFFYRDSSCDIPFGSFANNPMPADFSFSLHHRFLLSKRSDRRPTAAFKPVGQPFLARTLQSMYSWDYSAQTCVSANPLIDDPMLLTDLVEVTLPTYVAPLAIVSK